MTKIENFSDDVRSAAKQAKDYEDFKPKHRFVLMTDGQKTFFTEYFKRKEARHRYYVRHKLEIRLKKLTPEARERHKLASRKYRAKRRGSRK